MKISVIRVLVLSMFLMGLMREPLLVLHPVSINSYKPPKEVVFMRAFIDKVNPALKVEDHRCARLLPDAIYRHSAKLDFDWQRVFALAWQESDFDCHAKNSKDLGGAYGPYQIRRVWESVIGDPREMYFDPELATERVVRVIQYYQETNRFQELVNRNFRNPILCLYNTGETLKYINMRYCKKAGKKLAEVRQAWEVFKSGYSTTIGLQNTKSTSRG